MGSQRDTFLASEADAYFDRNRVEGGELQERIGGDPLLAALASVGVEPARVLEVGASDGWRLEAIRQRLPDACAVGIDPSRAALEAGARCFPGISLACGTAERLPFANRSFELVILGFCLYVVDRDDLFRIAAEVERVVATSGFVAILDFHSDTPVQTPYREIPGRYSYKMNYPAMFDWNPAYRPVYRELVPYPGSPSDHGGDGLAVTILQRDPKHAYRDGPIR